MFGGGLSTYAVTGTRATLYTLQSVDVCVGFMAIDVPNPIAIPAASHAASFVVIAHLGNDRSHPGNTSILAVM